MSDDLVARIDQVTEEWDSWDGQSADAMRWAPDLPERGAGVRAIVLTPQAARLVAELPAFRAAFAQLLTDLQRALVPVTEAMARIGDAALAVTAAAGVAVEEGAKRARPRRPAHVPPMWADVPTKQRRRR